ncbi:MAG: hypothetical protein ABI151_03655 [Chitinophagaceae bacterium]
MATISGFPYAELQFTKDAVIFDNNELAELNKMITDGSLSDLIVISHGWNNDMDDARSLYRSLVDKIARAQASTPDGKKFGILGILWPSKKFADKDLIAGGGAASAVSPVEKDKVALKNQLDALDGFFDGEASDAIIARARKLVDSMRTDKAAAGMFVREMNRLFKEGVKPVENEAEEDVIHSFGETSPDSLLARLQDEDIDLPNAKSMQGASDIGPIGSMSTQGMGAAAGTGFSLGNIFGAAKNLLNFVTYYQMKERAGKVGLTGLHPVLVKMKNDFPNLKLHMIGHSFGGRLVTAAVNGNPGATFQVDSLILLQAAFSHFGFAKQYDGSNDGFFRSVITAHKVKGVIFITFTHNDTAVGIAYAIASRIARQVGSFLGDKDDRFGGLGGNGAVDTPEAINDFHLVQDGTYTFKKGNLYNVNGDACIMGHSDICKDEVGRAIIAAVDAS